MSIYFRHKPTDIIMGKGGKLFLLNSSPEITHLYRKGIIIDCGTVIYKVLKRKGLDIEVVFVNYVKEEEDLPF